MKWTLKIAAITHKYEFSNNIQWVLLDHRRIHPAPPEGCKNHFPKILMIPGVGSESCSKRGGSLHEDTISKINMMFRERSSC